AVNKADLVEIAILVISDDLPRGVDAVCERALSGRGIVEGGVGIGWHDSGGAWQSGLAGRNGLASNKQTTRRVAICTHRQQRGTGPHSITSSARASSMGGTARPSIRAVSALMTRSNLLDCTTGRSAGLAPFQDAAGIDTELAKRIHDVGSITHQPANFDKVARRIDRREPVERRQLDHLDTPGIQESVGPDEQGIGP